MKQVAAVILAGGEGERFWPISRRHLPKQFLSIRRDGENLLRETARRIEPLCGSERLFVITNVALKNKVEECLPKAQVICEPYKRNTAAAIGLAALCVRHRFGDLPMFALPADHAVSNEKNLRETLAEAVDLADSGNYLVTIGIAPTFPHTGYGYIRRGAKLSRRAYRVGSFHEKPDLERATSYRDSGECYWNSGMFVWRTDAILAAIAEHMPALADGLGRIQGALGTNREGGVIEQVFSELEAVSIDYGVLEKAENCAVVIADDFGWSDVGSWDAWADHWDRDDAGNVCVGNSIVLESRNCVVYSKERLTAVLGLEDVIAIDAGDALLICKRDRAQDVKRIVAELKQKGREDLL